MPRVFIQRVEEEKNNLRHGPFYGRRTNEEIHQSIYIRT